MVDSVTAISTPQTTGPAPEPITASPAPVTTAPVVETAPAVESPVEVSSTVLGGDNETKQTTNTADPKAAEKATSEAADGTKEITEGGQSDNPAPPPQYEAFQLPENIVIAPERLTEFTSLLASLETEGKADHARVQEFGQKAVNMYAEALKHQVEATSKAYKDAFDAQKTSWKDQFMKDPELGGNRSQTTIDAAQSFIRTHGGTEAQQKEFRELMNTTGLGNHPIMIRLLANAGKTMQEGRPLAATKPVPSTPKSKLNTLYGTK